MASMQNIQSVLDDMKGAMARIQESASKAGLSTKEIISALETIYKAGNQQPFSAAAANEAFKTVLHKLNSNAETDEFQIKRFEIPNYKFD